MEADFLRLALIFLLLLLPLCACAAGNQNVATMNEAVGEVVNDGKSHFESLGATPLKSSRATHSVLEEPIERLEAPSLATQPVQQTEISVEWLRQAWECFETKENFLAENNNRSQINFPEPFICELHNFKSFFARFSEDIDFQISATRFPLKLTIRIPPWELPLSYSDNDNIAREEIKSLLSQT
jgi:hypothetical protein